MTTASHRATWLPARMPPMPRLRTNVLGRHGFAVGAWLGGGRFEATRPGTGRSGPRRSDMAGHYPRVTDDPTFVRSVPFDDRVATIHRSRAPLTADVGAALGWFLEGAFETDHMPDLFVTVAAKGLLEDVAR